VHAGWDVSINADGDYFVTGRVEMDDYDMFVSKYNSAGEQQWQQISTHTGSDYGTAVQAVGDGDVVVIGGRPETRRGRPPFHPRRPTSTTRATVSP
jgi:hypothetical protein